MADPLRSLDWSLIQSFVAVAEEGSLSAAARRLELSQPTLGRQIRAMEDGLGTQLFSRQPRGLSLSEEGAAMIDPARAMAEAAARLNLAAEGRQASLSGTVRITASEMTAQAHLPAIIRRIREEEPEIEVEIVASDESRNLLYREADIAVRMFQPTQLDIVARHLGDLETAAFAARSYLDTRPPITDIASLVAHDWVGFDASPLIIDGMGQAGIEVDRHFFGTRCDHNATYWALVVAGCGIGFGQVAVAAQCPEVVRIPLPAPVPPLPVWLAAPEAIRHTPRIARVWDMLAEGLQPLLA